MTKILVADDDKDDCERLALPLIERGFQVEIATDGRQAIDAGAWWQPEILVADCILGGIRGLKVAEALRLLKPSMSLILTTGYGSMDLAFEARKLEATALLEKPVEPEHLLHAAETAAGRPASDRPTTVAVIGTGPGGEIVFANPKARQYLASAGAGSEAGRIRDVFGPGARRTLRRATEEWQEVTAVADPQVVWQVRARSTPDAPGYLTVLLEGEQFLAQPDGSRRHYTDESLVRLLLDTPAEHRPRWPYGPGARALIIDGSDMFRHLAAAEIERADAIWHSASSPDEALRILRLDPGIRVIVLDDQALAEDAGLIDELRDRCHAEAEIVGQSLDDHRRAFTARGVERFVRKPWQIEELIRVLTAAPGADSPGPRGVDLSSTPR